MKNLLLSLVIISLFGCVSKNREKELLQKINQVETELNSCKYGAEKQFKRMSLCFMDSNFVECKNIFESMRKDHPESPYLDSSEIIIEQITIIESEIQKEKELLKKLHDEAVEKEKQKNLSVLKKLKKKYDDVSDITWYSNPYFDHWVRMNLVSIYIGQKNSNHWLRLKISYSDDDWIFFEKIYLSYDGNTTLIDFDKYEEKESDNGSGGIWEWIDVSVSDDLYEFLKGFSQSKNAKVRFVGKYSKTRNLSWEERQGFRDVLSGYKALSEIIP